MMKKDPTSHGMINPETKPKNEVINVSDQIKIPQISLQKTVMADVTAE